MTAWLVVVAVGLGTWCLRAVMFATVDARSLPAWVDRPLAYVGPAALGALVGSMLFTHGGAIQFAGGAELVAAAAAVVTVRRTGNVALGMATGFPVMWLLGAVIS